MHGPHSVSDIGDCPVIHCDAEGVSLVDQWKEEKNWYSLNWSITRWFLKPIKVGLITEHYTKFGLIDQHWLTVQSI